MGSSLMITPRTQAQRSAETRRALLNAAINTLHEHGYAVTTTLLVAERAGVTRGAMLHQFPTKADLMTFVVEAIYADEIECYHERLDGLTDANDRLLAYPEAVWKLFNRPAGIAVLEIIQGSRSDRVLARKLRPLLARIEADSRCRVEQRQDRAASPALLRLIVWTARGLSILKLLAPETNHVDDAVLLLRELIRAGLATGMLTSGRPASRTRK